MVDIDYSPSKRRKMSDVDRVSDRLAPKPTMLTTRSGYVVVVDELCRVIMQSLNNLGLNQTWQMMEKESQLQLLGQTTILISSIIDSGDWERLLSQILPSLSWPEVKNLEDATKAVYCLSTLELCLGGDSLKVLNWIRRAPSSLHGPLASLLLYSKEAAIKARFVKLFGEDFSSRSSLQAYILSLTDAKDCLDDDRLLSIIDSAYSNLDETDLKVRKPISTAPGSDRNETPDSTDGQRNITSPQNRCVSLAELIRLIYFALLNFGYSESAKTLLAESNVQFDYETGDELKQNILKGRWDAVQAAFSNQCWQNVEHFNQARMAVLRQHFFELCEGGDIVKAIEILRRDEAKSSLAPLARFILYRDPNKLRRAAQFDGREGNSRLQLWEYVQSLLQEELGLHPLQLVDLLDAAIDFDVKNCKFHNRPKTFPHSLLRRHECTDDDFPNGCIQVLSGHTDEVWFVAFSHDGSRLASASKDGTARIWEMKHDADSRWYQLHTFHLNAKASHLCWSADDSCLVTCAYKKRVYIWDVNTGFKICTLSGHKDHVLSCAWINDSTPKIATGSVDHQIIIWSLNGERLYNWRTPKAVQNMCVSLDQRHLFASASDYTVQVYDMKTMELVSDFREESQTLWSFAISSREPLLLVSVWKPASIHMWKIGDLRAATIVREFIGAVQDKFMIRCGFGGVDDHFVISGSEDCNVIIWNRHTGEQLCALSGHHGSVNSVSWNPTNPLLFASASDDHYIRLWASKSMIRERQTSRDVLPEAPMAS